MRTHIYINETWLALAVVKKGARAQQCALGRVTIRPRVCGCESIVSLRLSYSAGDGRAVAVHPQGMLGIITRNAAADYATRTRRKYTHTQTVA
jgi:hypothetical protein